MEKTKGARILKIAGAVLATPVIIVFLIIAALYVPAIQQYTVKKISETIAQNSDYNLYLEKFRLHFPLGIDIGNYTLLHAGDTLLQGERLRTDISIAPLLKGEIEVNYISIDSTAVDTRNLIDGLRIYGNIGHFRTSIRNIIPADSKIGINRLSFVDSNVHLTLGDKQEKDTTKSTRTDWIITLKRADIKNVNFVTEIPNDSISISAHIGETQLRNATINPNAESYTFEQFTLDGCAASYDNGAEPDTIVPTRHLKFDNIALQIDKFAYSPEAINGNLTQITLRQQSEGITIDNGNLQLNGDSTYAFIKKLHISSHNGSSLQATAKLPRKLLSDSNTNDKGNATLTLHLDKRDLRGFITSADYAKMKNLPDSMLQVAAQLHGNIRSLHVDTLYAQLSNIARVGFSGEASNLADNKKRSFDILFAGNTPGTTTQPLHINGTATLYHGEYSTNATLTHNGGSATAIGTYSPTSNSYNANIGIEKLGIAQLLPEVPLHSLTMELTLDGRGTDIYDKETQYTLTARIDTLHYDSIQLNSIDINATQEKSTSHIEIKSEDKALLMQLLATTKLDNRTINNHTNITAQRIDLRHLGLTSAPADAAMQLQATLTTDLDERYALNATGSDLHFTHNSKQHKADSLHLCASTLRDTTMLHLATGDLNINGNINAGYRTILSSIEKVKNLAISKYQAHDTILDITEYEHLLPSATLNISSGKKNLLADYLEIKGITYNKVDFQGRLDSLQGLRSRGTILDLEHNNQHLDTLRLAITQDSSKVRYFAGIRSRATREGNDKATFGAALYGTLDKEKLAANYIFRDKNDVVGMKIGATAKVIKEGVQIVFLPQATLFKQPFLFNSDNNISIDHDMNIRGNIELIDTTTNSGMNLYATSDTLYKRDITLELFNIDLLTATRVLPYAPDLAGTINADLHYREDKEGTIISSDIRSDGLTYEGTLIGNETLELSYFPKNNTKHHAYATLLHNDKSIAQLEGVYNSDSLNGKNRGELQLTRFPLSIANAFLNKANSSAGGYVDGKINIDNTGERPIGNGYISFDSAYADLPQFGTTLHLVDDQIELTDNTLKINDFDIYAKGDTPFKINGTIDLNNLADPLFNLRMRANNYEIVNAKRSKGAILYGRMFTNLNSRITGKLSTLKVDGSATVLGKSDVTYVIQDTPLETENDLDGLVTFTNFKDTTTTVREVPDYDLGNITMNITLSVEEGARINADFDTERTSYIELQGEGNLNLTYTAEAGMNLTGRYRLSNGLMKYTLPVIPLKTFNIKEGSSINWNGDILNPTLDITAMERVITSVIIDDNSQAVGFDVGIKLTNTLDNMGLSFTLSAPDNAAVQSQLNSVDAETLNKYALTMLITGAYIGGENSLTVSGALSSFIDAKINNLVAGAMNSTVDINVGITDLEDAATGDTYKNYSFSFTKRFWNDRLKVIIGGEVNDNANANTNQSFINNVSLEWKISNSGNRYLRLFYDKNYESILEGEITEAGIGYVYKRKLNNLNELLIFRRKQESPIERYPQKGKTTGQ